MDCLKSAYSGLCAHCILLNMSIPTRESSLGIFRPKPHVETTECSQLSHQPVRTRLLEHLWKILHPSLRLPHGDLSSRVSISPFLASATWSKSEVSSVFLHFRPFADFHEIIRCQYSRKRGRACLSAALDSPGNPPLRRLPMNSQSLVSHELARIAKIDFLEPRTVAQDSYHVLPSKPRGVPDLNVFKLEKTGEMPNEKGGLNRLDIGASLSPGPGNV